MTSCGLMYTSFHKLLAILYSHPDEFAKTKRHVEEGLGKDILDELVTIHLNTQTL